MQVSFFFQFFPGVCKIFLVYGFQFFFFYTDIRVLLSKQNTDFRPCYFQIFLFSNRKKKLLRHHYNLKWNSYSSTFNIHAQPIYAKTNLTIFFLFYLKRKICFSTSVLFLLINIIWRSIRIYSYVTFGRILTFSAYFKRQNYKVRIRTVPAVIKKR